MEKMQNTELGDVVREYNNACADLVAKCGAQGPSQGGHAGDYDPLDMYGGPGVKCVGTSESSRIFRQKVALAAAQVNAISAIDEYVEQNSYSLTPESCREALFDDDLPVPTKTAITRLEKLVKKNIELSNERRNDRRNGNDQTLRGPRDGGKPASSEGIVKVKPVTPSF